MTTIERMEKVRTALATARTNLANLQNLIEQHKYDVRAIEVKTMGEVAQMPEMTNEARRKGECEKRLNENETYRHLKGALGDHEDDERRLIAEVYNLIDEFTACKSILQYLSGDGPKIEMISKQNL